MSSGMTVDDLESDPNSSSATTIYHEQGIPIEFPFTPYPAQKQMISKMIQAFEHCQNAILESPTGSGKSLAILVASLAWIKYKSENIVETPAADDIETSNPFSNEADLSWMGSDADVFKQLLSQGKFDSAFSLYNTRKLERPKAPVKSSERKSGTKWNPASKQDIPKIYIASRTHKQIAQLINELKIKTAYSPRTSVLGSRKQYCINEQVNYLDNIDDSCKLKVERKACSALKEILSLEGHPDIQPGGVKEVWDIEDLVQIGTDINACPYYASRSIAQNAEVVFCPYNYLIDPMIRKSMGIDVKNCILIIDEAHNVESTARDTGSFEASISVIGLVQAEIKEVLRYRNLVEANTVLASLLSIIRNWVEKSEFKFGDGEKDNKLVQCFTGDAMMKEFEKMTLTRKSFSEIYYPAFQNVLAHFEDQNTSEKNSEAVEVEERNPDGTVTIKLKVISKKTISGRSIRVLEKLFLVLDFIFDQVKSRSIDYTLAVLKKKPTIGRQSDDYDFCLWCMNSGVIFTGLAEAAHSVILTSGTLSPMETFESELEVSFPIQLIADHVIDKSQVWANIISSGPSNYTMTGTYQYAKQPKYLEEVSLSICKTVQNIPYGVLCFFPSYAALNTLYDYISTTNTAVKSTILTKKKIFIEPQNKPTSEFNELLEEYYDCIKSAVTNPSSDGVNGALFFAVYRGKVSEGIDFNDDNCRGVICIGIPFPNYGDKLVQLKRQYNDKKKQSAATPYLKSRMLTGTDWYDIQGYRAINQALGRCIRHKKDWGAIILLENRFCEYRHSKRLSKWVVPLLQKRVGNFKVAMEELHQFVNKHNWKSTKGYRLGGSDEGDNHAVEDLSIRSNGSVSHLQRYQKLINAFKSASNQAAESSKTGDENSKAESSKFKFDDEARTSEENSSDQPNLTHESSDKKSAPESIKECSKAIDTSVNQTESSKSGSTSIECSKTVEKTEEPTDSNSATSTTNQKPKSPIIYDLTDSPEIVPKQLSVDSGTMPQQFSNAPPQPLHGGSLINNHTNGPPLQQLYYNNMNGPPPFQPPHNNGLNGPPHFQQPHNNGINGPPHFQPPQNNGMSGPPPFQPPHNNAMNGLHQPPFHGNNIPEASQNLYGQMAPLPAGIYGPPPGYVGPWHIIYRPATTPDGETLPPQPFIVFAPPPQNMYNGPRALLPMPPPQNQEQAPTSNTLPPKNLSPGKASSNNASTHKKGKGKELVTSNPAPAPTSAPAPAPIAPKTIHFTKPIVNHISKTPVAILPNNKGKEAVRPKGKAAVRTNAASTQLQPTNVQAPPTVPPNTKAALPQTQANPAPVPNVSASKEPESNTDQLLDKPIKSEAPEHYRMANSTSLTPKSKQFIVYHIKRKYLDFDANGVPSLRKVLPLIKKFKPMSKPHVESVEKEPSQVLTPAQTPTQTSQQKPINNGVVNMETEISSFLQKLNLHRQEQSSAAKRAGGTHSSPANTPTVPLPQKQVSATPKASPSGAQSAASVRTAQTVRRIPNPVPIQPRTPLQNRVSERAYVQRERQEAMDELGFLLTGNTRARQNPPMSRAAPAQGRSSQPAPPQGRPPQPAAAQSTTAQAASTQPVDTHSLKSLENTTKALIQAIARQVNIHKNSNKSQKGKIDREVQGLKTVFNATKSKCAAFPAKVLSLSKQISKAEAEASAQMQKDQEELAVTQSLVRASLEAQITASVNAYEKALAARLEATRNGADQARLMSMVQAESAHNRLTTILTKRYKQKFGQLPPKKDKGKQAAPKTTQPVDPSSSSSAASSSTAASSSSSAPQATVAQPAPPHMPRFKSELSIAGKNISFFSNSSAIKNEPGTSTSTGEGSSSGEVKSESAPKRTHNESVVEFVETASGLILPKRRKKK